MSRLVHQKENQEKPRVFRDLKSCLYISTRYILFLFQISAKLAQVSIRGVKELQTYTATIINN